jgi:hypothetical protein
MFQTIAPRSERRNCLDLETLVGRGAARVTRRARITLVPLIPGRTRVSGIPSAARVTGCARIALVSLITGCTGIAGCTRIAGGTCVTRCAHAACAARTSGIPGIPRVASRARRPGRSWCASAKREEDQ